MASTGEQQHKWAEDGGVRDPKATCSSLGEMVAKFEGGGGDPANFLSQARDIVRAAGDPASWISTPRMQGIAQRMLDLTFQDTGEGSAEAAGDARFFACRLLDQILEKQAEEGPRDVNSVIFLSRKITSTAKAYQRCGAHAKASQALDRAGVHITRALQEGGFDERTGESVLYLHCEILYHKIEILSALDTVPGFSGKAKVAVQESRVMVEKDNLPPTFSAKFGILCYNIGVHHIKADEEDQAGRARSAEEALFWSEQAANFFRVSSRKAELAASKSLSAKARITLGDFDSAHNDLQAANGLDPTPRSLLLELQCLTHMNRHDDASAFIAGKITQENWKALPTGEDASEAKASLSRTWILFAMHLAEANRADAANDTFARILSVVQTDGEAKYYEEAHVHWISALSTTGIRDLGLCSAQVETLTRRHRENPCAPLTQKRVLAICSTIIREFDSSGSFKKSIEWRQRVMPWTTEADSSAMAKQIVRIAVRIGAMDVAEQYMLKCGPEDRDTLVLKMQVMFKAAKPGDRTEAKVEALLEMLLSREAALSPSDAVDVLNTAFCEAHGAGYEAVARRCLRGFVAKVAATSVEEMPDVVVHQLFVNVMMLLCKVGDDGDGFCLSDGVSEGEVFEMLAAAAQYIAKNGLPSFCKDDAQAVHSLSLLSDIAWNMAVRTMDVKKDEPCDYITTSRLYDMAATFCLCSISIGKEHSDAAQACLSLYLSASCTLMHVRNASTGSQSCDNQLRTAYDTVSRIRSTRREHGLETSVGSVAANEARLEFELACMLRKDAAVLHAMTSKYIKEVLPALRDEQARLTSLKTMCAVCYATEAPYTVTAELCASALHCFPAGGDRTRSDVEEIADVQMLRIVRGHKDREGTMAIFEELLLTAKEHPADYPPQHIRDAAIMAYNTGDDHRHWERAKQAEQWIGMSVKLANACPAMPVDLKETMHAVYGVCLQGLRA